VNLERPRPLSSVAEKRARISGGASSDAIYRMAARALEARCRSGTLLDVGCGSGRLWPFVRGGFDRYIGADIVRYDGFPSDCELVLVDLDGGVPLADGTADVVAAIETVEHLENPRAFVRELSRLARPSGWVLLTTPNQLSVLSLATLAVKGRFAAFQDVHYPSHLTALLEVDLRRIAAECGLREVSVAYSGEGRVVFTPAHYPAWLAALCPRGLSDNVLVIGRKS